MARLTPVTADKPFYTRDQYPVVFLTGNMLHSSPVFGVVSLTGRLSGMPTPDGGKLRVGNLGFVPAQPDDLAGYSLGWLGEMRLTLDVFRDLGAAFIVALLLILSAAGRLLPLVHHAAGGDGRHAPGGGGRVPRPLADAPAVYRHLHDRRHRPGWHRGAQRSAV